MVQYFTFLGLGSKPEGYKEVIYTFQDDPVKMILIMRQFLNSFSYRS